MKMSKIPFQSNQILNVYEQKLGDESPPHIFIGLPKPLTFQLKHLHLNITYNKQ